MRVTSKSEGDALVRGIANSLASSKEPAHTVIAGDKADTKDEAKQSAVTYWMMGWTWDEIETVLEDCEYPAAAIKYALAEAKEYAKTILNEGPFAVMQAGQGVRLVSGEIGVVADRHADHVTVHLDGTGRVKVTASQIDVSATQKLTQSFALRSKAASLIRKLSDGDIGHTASASVVRVRADSLGNIVADTTQEALNRISALRQASDEMHAEASLVQDRWAENTPTWKAAGGPALEFAQYVAAMIEQENIVNEEFASLIYRNAQTVLEQVYNAAVGVGPSADDADQKLVAYLQNDLLSALQAVEAHTYDVREKNAKIREYVSEYTAFKGSPAAKAAGWVGESVTWAKSAWDSTKEFSGKWESDISKSVQAGIDRMSEYVTAVNSAQEKNAVSAVLSQTGLSTRTRRV